jgi:hypothetical protein
LQQQFDESLLAQCRIVGCKGPLAGLGDRPSPSIADGDRTFCIPSLASD